MQLPVMPPVKPMLAKADKTGLPAGDDWLFEPKWDGFRCIVFRDGDEIVLGSRNEKPLTRYFPELLDPIKRQLPDRCVVDGEIVVMGDDHLEFEWLQQRIHPAESRINKLAKETPASFIAFDLLALDDRSLMDEPFRERRRLLAEAMTTAGDQVHLTPITTDRQLAADWFARFEGAGLDGVVAKSPELKYVPDKRVMVKVKKARTADCVVAGYRVHKDGNGVGSLLLGIYTDDGDLAHVGVCASFTAARRPELLEELQPLREGATENHPWGGWAESQEQAGDRAPGAVSRWNAQKDLSFVPLRCERVVEVGYDYMQGHRFRTVARFVRWRPDRTPESCTYDQLEVEAPIELKAVLRGDTS